MKTFPLLNSDKIVTCILSCLLWPFFAFAQPCSSPATAAGYDKEICKGSFAILGCDPNPDYCYKWMPEDGIDAPLSSMTKATPEITTTYTLLISDGNGNFLGADEVTVTVYSVDVEIEGSTTICPGSNITLSAITSSSEPATYEWNTGETAKDIIVAPQETSNYSITITSEVGCQAIAYAIVNVQAIPESVFSPEHPVVCSSNPSNVAKIEILNFDQMYTYQWSNGVSGKMISVTQPGFYTVTVTDNSGCFRIDKIEVIDVGDANQLKMLFESLGFLSFPVAIEDPTPFQDNPPTGQKQVQSLTYVDNYAELLVDMVASTPTINVADQMESFFNDVPEFPSKHGYVTKNENICEILDFFNSTLNDLSSQELGYWAHIWQANPSDATGILFVLGKTPVYDQFSPVDDDHKEFIYKVFDNAKSEPNTYSYATKNDQLADLVFFHDVRSHVADNLMDILKDDEVEIIDPCATQEPGYFVSPTGMPILLPAGTILRFGHSSLFEGLVDFRALTGFTTYTINNIPGGIYAAHGFNDTQISTGYKNIYDPKSLYDFDISNIPLPPLPVEVRTGAKSNGFSIYDPFTFTLHETGANYEIWYNDYFYSSSVSINVNATGTLVSEFIGLYSKSDPKGYLVYTDPLPGPPNFNLTSPLSVQYDPTHYLNQLPYSQNIISGTKGWVFKVANPAQPLGFDWIFAAYYNSAPNVLQYKRFINCIGDWEDYTPDPASNFIDVYEIIGALLLDIYKHPHEFLDFAGTLPVYGEVFDVVNAVWYLAEGNWSQAGLSALCVIPFIDVEIKAGKYVLKYGDELKDAEKILSAYRTGTGVQTTKVVFVYNFPGIIAKVSEKYGISAAIGVKLAKLFNWLEKYPSIKLKFSNSTLLDIFEKGGKKRRFELRKSTLCFLHTYANLQNCTNLTA